MGLGAQKNLETLCIHYVSLGDESIKTIKEAMRGVTSLKKLQFSLCQIKEEAKQINYIALNNPALQELNVSNNPLGEEGIKNIARALPVFRNLTILNLDETGINYSALNFLVSICLEEKLNIASLSLSCNKIDDPSLDLLIRFIDKNSTLKSLRLDFCNIDDLKFQKLSPVLIDPSRCQLEYFSFGGNPEFSRETYDMLLNILRKNEFLCNLLPTPICYIDEHRALCNINTIKRYLREWEIFITTALCLLNLSYLKDRPPVPHELLCSVLLFIVPQTPNMQSDSPLLCIQLIQQNLEKRHKLMEEKKYNPAAKLKKNDYENNKQIISRWWSCSISNSKNASGLLFLPKNERQPDLIELKNIVLELKPFLSKVIVLAGEQGLSIDLSSLSKKRQL